MHESVAPHNRTNLNSSHPTQSHFNSFSFFDALMPSAENFRLHYKDISVPTRTNYGCSYTYTGSTDPVNHTEWLCDRKALYFSPGNTPHSNRSAKLYSHSERR
jgi:hypothetical protein